MNSKVIIIIGDQRSGKTFFCENLIRAIANNTRKRVLVYNKGKKEDFDREFTKIEFVDNPEEKVIRKFRLFATDKEIPIKYLSRTKEKLFVSYRMSDSIEQEKLFRSWLHYMGGFVFVADDCLFMFRHGVQSGFIELVTRMNHCGIRSGGVEGSDIILIFHHPDNVPSKIWDAATDVLIFHTKRDRLKETGNYEVDEQIDFAIQDLKKRGRGLKPEEIYKTGFYELNIYTGKKVHRNSDFYKSIS